MKYKGIIGHGRKQGKCPDVKILSIVTNTKQDTQVVCTHVSMKSQMKIRATAQMIDLVPQMLLAIKALSEFENGRIYHGKTVPYNLNRAIVWQFEQAMRTLLNSKVLIAEGFALYFYTRMLFLYSPL
jgi:hypothetical protein